MRYARVSALLFTIVFMAYYFYGIRAVFVTGVSVLSSFLTDYLCVSAMKKKFDWTDESPLMSGLLLALLMPATVPYSIMAFSAAFMTVVGKYAFGGNDNLIFCPVCVAYIFTSLCFPSSILRYPLPVPFGKVPTANIVTDGLTNSYTHFLDNNAVSTFSLLDIIWGKLAGPMGTSAVLIILICAVALYFFRDIPSMALFAGFGANVIINVVFPVGERGWYAVLNSLVAGSYLFVLVFMACDVRYVPKKQFSQLLYGILFAAGSFLMRKYTTIENGAVFMLPILCIFRDEFDRLTHVLHRLLALLWKWVKLLAGKAAKAFDAICEAVSDRIVKASKERRKQADEDAKDILDGASSEADLAQTEAEGSRGQSSDGEAIDPSGEESSPEADKAEKENDDA